MKIELDSTGDYHKVTTSRKCSVVIIDKRSGERCVEELRKGETLYVHKTYFDVRKR